jgi:hypothetical protein
MGSLQAAEMAEMLSLEDAIAWQLRGNHYPPIPLTMVQPCIEAIHAYNGLDYDLEIEMPEGVFYKGMTTAPAWAIVEQHHLHPWIELDEYEDED